MYIAHRGLFIKVIFIIAICLISLSGCLLTNANMVSSEYFLSLEGYSSKTNNLLFHARTHIDGILDSNFLAYYNICTGHTNYLFPMSEPPFDFSWQPGQDAFIVTHGDRISIFEKSDSYDKYLGKSIQCPIKYIYIHIAHGAPMVTY